MQKIPARLFIGLAILGIGVSMPALAASKKPNILII